MKKHLTTLLLIFTASTLIIAQNGTINLNGKECTIDTLEYWQAGPGIQHTAFVLKIGSTKHNCYMLDIDLTNPYNTIEEYQAASQMGSTEKLSSAYQKLDAANHRTIGGVNCNFWCVSSQDIGETQGLVGQPYAGTARNGVMIGEPSNWNAGHGDRGYVIIDRNKKVWIDNMDFAGTIVYNGQEHSLRDVNRTRINPSDNEIALFNHYLGSKPTRTTDGIEVVFKTTDWKINETFQCEVTGINKKGGTQLTEGMGVLQGRGTGKDFLSTMQVGDRFEINLGVFSTNNAELRPDIMQMVTGNALLLSDGVQTKRNTNESYNNKNYPRTLLATNAEHNRLWMFVAETPGMYTADMCALLQQCGATYASGLDGGGSAQMCLFGNVINKTTESSPRAVANSLWVFSTAPDDNVITSLSTSVNAIRLPKYGVFKPTFKGYNQYGVLINPDVQDVVLSCDEATGYIDEQGRFVCLGNGMLTATTGETTLNIEIRIDNSAKASIRLDSVLVSDDTDYTIEVTAVVGKNTMLLQPAALIWTVQDENICTVSTEGVLNGLTNGTTWIYGTLDNLTDSLLVHVEIPETRPLLWNNPTDTWKITPSSSAWNTQIRTGKNDNTEIYINYNGGRQANIKCSINSSLYSLPNSLEFRFTPNGFPISKLNMNFSTNNTKNGYSFATLPNIQTRNTILVNLDSLCNPLSDIAVYPLQLNTITFQLDMNAEHKEYTMEIEGIWLHYGEISLGVESVSNPAFTVYPNPAGDILYVNGCEAGAMAVFYDLQGREVLRRTLSDEAALDISQLGSGNWVLSINGVTMKVMKK